VTGPAYLLGLAFEALLGLVGPPACKSRLARIDHARIKGMDLSIVANVCLDGRQDCPATLGGVLKMLLERIVVLFPAGKRLAAEKTFDTIGTAVKRVEEEAGFRKLDGTCQRRSANHNSWHRGSRRRARAICAANGAPSGRASSRWTPCVFLRRVARPEKTTGGFHRQSIGLWPRSWPLLRCYARGSGGGCSRRRETLRGRAMEDGGREKSIAMLRASRPCPKKNGD
jgi:hypothetical protein